MTSSKEKNDSYDLGGHTQSFLRKRNNEKDNTAAENFKKNLELKSSNRCNKIHSYY